MLRGKLFYKDRAFMVYLTIDGLGDKVHKYCKRYGISHSKLAQQAIVEKLEKEVELARLSVKGVRGSQATTLATPPDTPTPPSLLDVIVSKESTNTILCHNEGGPGT
jgi:hypothetical protein